MSPSPNNASNNYNPSEAPPNPNSTSAVNNNPSVDNNINVPSTQQSQQPPPNNVNGGADPLEQPAGVTPSFVGSLKLDFEPNPFEHSFGSTATVNQQQPGPSTSRPAPSAIPPSFSRTLLPPVSSIASPDILGAPGVASPLAYPAWSGFTRGGMQNPLSPAIYDATLRPDYLNTPSDPSMAMGSRFSFGTGFTPGGNDSFRSLLTPTGASFPAPSPGTANLLGFQPFDSQYPDQYRFTPRDGKPPVSAGTNGEQSDYFGANAAVHGLCLLSQVPEQQKMQPSVPNETDPSTSAAVANLLKQSQSQQYPDSIRPSFTHNANNSLEAQNMGQSPYYMNANQLRGDMQPSVYGETVNPADPSLNLRPSNNYGMNMNNMSHIGQGGNREMPSNGMPVQVKSEVNERQDSQPRAMSGHSNVSPSASPSEADMKDLDSTDFNGESNNSKSGSTPRRNSKNETDDEKRKSFLERNRQAALKCRQRKKQWLSNLQAKVEFYGNENEILSAQVSALREEIVSLKTLLIAHKDCPVAKGNSAAVATTIIGNGDMSQRINLGY
ncbi:transcription factor Atf1 [Schizosaccharomyces cryophilus OY26]|uniref:Transcription factor Atf1 n=1 Tax=Schizosaccharomyces cryophilus (strain OY26 / ATCC MYA-4695 / CBS 11777 / NBRC 106824 / NRRL Y48691) TaxID=653667 RepID=S9VSM9_SCHCR|nr:transcription factor Atf1 [Schizosaccharomyces cryophilus OY26]EPY49189.1 transcription factor Atf1 [Schizosaccharomyces cryophilus OY26]